MAEIPDSLSPKTDDSRRAEELIRWRTISYRTVAVYSCAILLVIAIILTVLFPQWWMALGELLGSTPKPRTTAANLSRSARFTNLDGGVRVRKANQVQWTVATVSMPLQEGDTVQTLRDGMARIAFADGALYVVKPGSLIVLEDAAPDTSDHANFVVQVSSGVVDLSTSHAGGDSRVLFADAEARIHQESRALLSSDPQTNTHQITVSKGGARLLRQGEQVDLAQYEQASFRGLESRIVKAKILAPPTLLTPANMAPIVTDGSHPAEVEFTWSAVPDADSYRLRVSSSPIFVSIIHDQRVRSTSVRLPGFKAGDYYWSVASISTQKESQAADANQFSVRQQDQGELLLTVDKFIQHGKAIEVIGRTEPGATVLVNNEPVFSVAPDGSFKHFTAPLPNTGANLITITAQNSKGKVATLRKTVTIQ